MNIIIVNADILINQIRVRSGGAAAGVLFDHDAGKTHFPDFEKTDLNITARSGDFDATHPATADGTACARDFDAVSKIRIVVAAQLNEFAIVQVNCGSPGCTGIAWDQVADRCTLGRVMTIDDDNGKLGRAGPIVETDRVPGSSIDADDEAAVGGKSDAQAVENRNVVLDGALWHDQIVAGEVLRVKNSTQRTENCDDAADSRKPGGDAGSCHGDRYWFRSYTELHRGRFGV